MAETVKVIKYVTMQKDFTVRVLASWVFPL